MKRLGEFLLPLDGMLVHRRSLPRKLVRFPQQFPGTHLYSWVERGTVRVKCLNLAQEHNTLSPATARLLRERTHRPLGHYASHPKTKQHTYFHMALIKNLLLRLRLLLRVLDKFLWFSLARRLHISQAKSLKCFSLF